MKLRTNRIVGYVVAAVTLGLLSMSAPMAWHWWSQKQAENALLPRPVIASVSENAQILGALRSAGVFERQPGNADDQRATAMLIADSTLCFSSERQFDAHACSDYLIRSLTSADYDQTAPRALRREMVFANMQPTATDVSALPDARTIAKAEVRQLLDQGFWAAFYEKYPNTAGWIEFTRPVLSPDRQKALLLLGRRCGGLCGSGHMYLLEFRPSGWVIRKQEVVWKG